LSRSQGFVVTAANEPVPVTSLSSGEQHQLVMLSELLFRTVPGSLVLVDEPEISLNVTWQEAFLSDLSRIRELVAMDFLIATHSPQIVNGRWDLTRELTDRDDASTR